MSCKTSAGEYSLPYFELSERRSITDGLKICLKTFSWIPRTISCSLGSSLGSSLGLYAALFSGCSNLIIPESNIKASFESSLVVINVIASF